MTMLAYFPEIGPDELLYSVLARLGRHRGIRAQGRLMEELFGRRHAIASFDLPGGIGALVARLSPTIGWDADAIIDRATVFPFHTAFVSTEVREGTRRAMVDSTAGAHLRLGLVASRIPRVQALRFCPECLGAMIAARGESYWRRAHQLPGITVCVDHGVPLLRSSVMAGRTGRHGFVAADDADLVGDGGAGPAVDRAILARLRKLAAAAVQLLETPPEARDPADISEAYRARLARVGLATGAKVSQAEFEQAFRAYWGSALDHVSGVYFRGELRGDWLASLVRPRPRAMHPVYHLLLRLFLDQLLEVRPPFGSGPWECRNPLAPHFGESVVSSVRVRRDRSRLYGDFECGCGYVYTCRRDANGTIGPARYRSYGPSLAPALTAAIAAEESLRAVARRLRLDPRTVMREAAIAGIATPWRLRPSGAANRFESDLAGTGRRPAARRPRPGRCSRDWTFADRLIARAVGPEAVAIRALEPPVRVTFGELERRMASPSWLRDRRDNLPLTVARIASVVETTDAFRMRRLEFALSQAEGLSNVTASSIVRSAGLPSSWIAKVRAEFAARSGPERGMAA